MNTAALSLLADATEAKKSGPLGLAVILVLCVACYFLFKSMSRQLKKVPPTFDPDESAAGADEPAAPDTAGADPAVSMTKADPPDPAG